jgi:hypothetical protein
LGSGLRHCPGALRDWRRRDGADATDDLPNDAVDAGASDDQPDSIGAEAGLGGDEPDASDGQSGQPDSTPNTEANAACLYLDEGGQLQLEVLHDCLSKLAELRRRSVAWSLMRTPACSPTLASSYRSPAPSCRRRPLSGIPKGNG